MLYVVSSYILFCLKLYSLQLKLSSYYIITDLHEMTHSVSSLATTPDGPTGTTTDPTGASSQQFTESNQLLKMAASYLHLHS